MIGPLDNLHTGFSYWGLKYNLSFYTKKYGGIFNAFGVDTSLSGKKEDTKSKNKTGPFSDDPFGGNNPFDGDNNPFGGSNDPFAGNSPF